MEHSIRGRNRVAFDNHAGTNKLARIMSSRMKAESAGPLILDFGSINGNYSLTTNTFPVEIPKGDYSVCRHVSGMSLGISGGTHGGHGSGDGVHSHTVDVPLLKPGDRVLVAWVQNDAIVIDVITPASSL